MRFTDKIKYNIKRGLPALAIAGAGLMAHGCSDEPAPTPHDVELKFRVAEYDEIDDNNVQKYAKDQSVRYIYLCVEGSFTNFNQQGITGMRKYMEKTFNIAPNKIRGRGNWIFKPGLALKSDSLWYVQHGWTVNQHQK